MSNCHVDFITGYYGIEFNTPTERTADDDQLPLRDPKRFAFRDDLFPVVSAFATLCSFLQFRRVDIGEFIKEATDFSTTHEPNDGNCTGPNLIPFGDQRPISLLTEHGGEHIPAHKYFYEGFQYAKREGLWL